VGTQRSINLNNLPADTYTIQLRAIGKPGIEKNAAVLVEILSPLWQRKWFISLVVVVLGVGAYMLYLNRIKRIRQKANLDKLLAETEMKALQAQMNPHFVFNSLNSIGEMILNNENKDASHYLSKFARLIRITLDQSSQAMVSLRNTLDYLERYLEMEHIRNSYFTFHIVVDGALDIDETFVPPMLLQPFIENAIWHGVSAQRKNIHIQINFRKASGCLVCTIDDNGVGLHQSMPLRSGNGLAHQPVGIANIQNRIRLLNEKYDMHCELHILDKKDIPGTTETGTRVTLQLPLEMEES
jgi:sensor histidine kinase YesM